MRLEPSNHAAFGKVLGALDACGNFCRIVSKVIDKRHTIERSEDLVTAEHARERRKRISTCVERNTGAERSCSCGQGIFHIVLARQRNFELHKFIAMANAELDVSPDRLKVNSLDAHIAFIAKVKFTASAELLCKRMRIVHNQDMACAQDVLAELEENLFKLGDFLVVFIDVQNNADFRFIANKRSIAFINFGNEPFTLATHSVTYLALSLQIHKTSPRHHRRLESCVVENVVDHRGYRRLSARAANGNRARFLRNLREHFTAVHHRNAKFLCTF